VWIRVLPDPKQSEPCWAVLQKDGRDLLTGQDYVALSRNPLDGHRYAVTVPRLGQRPMLLRLDREGRSIANSTMASAQLGWVFTASVFSASGDLLLLRQASDVLYVIDANDVLDMFAFGGSLPFRETWPLLGLVKISIAALFLLMLALTTLRRFSQSKTHRVEAMAFHPSNNGQLYLFDNELPNYRLGTIGVSSGTKSRRVQWYGRSQPQIVPITKIYFDSFGALFGLQENGNYWLLPTYSTDERKEPVLLGNHSALTSGHDMRPSCNGRIQMSLAFTQTSSTPILSRIYEGETVQYTLTIANANNFTVNELSLVEDFAGDPQPPRTFVEGTLVIHPSVGPAPMVNQYGGSSGLRINGLSLVANRVTTLTVQVRIPKGTDARALHSQAILSGVTVGLGGPEVRSDDPATPTFADPTTLHVHQRILVTDDSAAVADDRETPLDVLVNDMGVLASTLRLLGPGPSLRQDATNSDKPMATAHGSAWVKDGKIWFKPKPRFLGNERLQYEACEAPDRSNCGTGTVVMAVSLAVRDDQAMTAVNTPVAIAVTENDSPFASPATLRLVRGGRKAMDIAVNLTSRSIVYHPRADSWGTDSFDYQICAAVFPDNCASATVYLGIHLPIAKAEVTTAHGLPLSVDLHSSPLLTFAADTTVVRSASHGTPYQRVIRGEDAPSASLSTLSSAMSIVTPPEHGSAAFVSGKLSYTPAPGYVGDDVVVYSACVPDAEDEDERLASCATSSVLVTVLVEAFPDTASPVPCSSSEGVIIDVLENDSPSLPANANLTVSARPSHGTAEVVQLERGKSPQISYIPNRDFAGLDRFSYQVCIPTRGTTPNCATASAIVPIAYLATDDWGYTLSGESVTLSLLDNDCSSGIDAGKRGFTYTLPSHGRLLPAEGAAAGHVVYSPEAGWFGNDQFAYKVCVPGLSSISLSEQQRDDLLCDDAVVRISVLQMPVAHGDQASTEEGISIEIDVLANDVLPSDQGDGHISLVSDPQHGDAWIDDGRISYSPSFGSAGRRDTFVYRLCVMRIPPFPPGVPPGSALHKQTIAACAIANVTIDVLLQFAPHDDFAFTERDTPVAIDVLHNDIAADPTTLTLLLEHHAKGVAIKRGTTGVVVYQPPQGASGHQLFRYRV